MGKHDSKQAKLQVNIIENRDPAIDAIRIDKRLRGSDFFDTNSSPLDYVMRKDIEEFSTGKIQETYTEADLVEEEYGGVWYLPVILPENSTPINVRIDQAEFTKFRGADSWAAIGAQGFRVSGFDTNQPQTITLTYI